MTNFDQEFSDYVTAFERNTSGYLPGNSVDCVILGYADQELKVLLLKWKHDDSWALPGGFINKDEHLDEAAQRVLTERTGLESIFLKQFHTFGSSIRSNFDIDLPRPKNHLKKLQEEHPVLFKWLSNRFITTGYFALVNLNDTKPKPDGFSELCEWKSIDSLPNMILDHSKILQSALLHLKIQLNYLPIGISLLPKKFTMQDLRKLYEAILGKSLERSNFQRKLLKLDILIRHEKQMTGAANKAPYLYSFNIDNYNALLNQGIGFSN